MNKAAFKIYSHWDRLPYHVQDIVFLYTDLDTVLLSGHDYIIRKVLQSKRVKRQFTWSNAAARGKVIWMRYFLRHKITVNHAPHLIELSLKHGHVEAATFIWQHRHDIRKLLWPKIHNRNYNQLVKISTMKSLVRKKQFLEAKWLLVHTNTPFDDDAFDYLDLTDPVEGELVQLMFENVTNRRRNLDHKCHTCNALYPVSVINSLLFRLVCIQIIRYGILPSLTEIMGVPVLVKLRILDTISLQDILQKYGRYYADEVISEGERKLIIDKKNKDFD